MKNNERTYEKIQKYLDNELDEEDRLAFESEMASDLELAREVNLNRDLKIFLSDSPENDLRKSLQILNNRVVEEPKGKGGKWKYLFFVIALLIVGGRFFINSDSADTEKKDAQDEIMEELSEPESKNELEVIDSIQTEETPSTNSIEKKIEEKSVEDEDVRNEKKINPPKKEEIQTKERPIANDIRPPQKNEEPILRGEEAFSALSPANMADFEPNPQIEILIENTTRNNDFELMIEQKQEDLKITKTYGEVDFQFKAVLKSSQKLKDKNFKLHIFSNDKKEFDDFNPSFSFDISLENTEEDSYQINFQKKLTLKPGLYYYLLEDFDIEKIYFTEKFNVKN